MINDGIKAKQEEYRGSRKRHATLRPESDYRMKGPRTAEQVQ